MSTVLPVNRNLPQVVVTGPAAVRHAWQRHLPTGVIVLLVLLSFPTAGRCDKIPLWEVGIGYATLFLPDYRGASHDSVFFLPFPYVTYHGKLLKIDKSGIQGRIFGTDRIHLNLSIAGGVPVSSRNNEARAGMPNLDPTVEIGPSLDFGLWSSRGGHTNLWFKIPIRAVFSLSLSDTTQRGWVFAPFFEYEYDDSPLLKHWDLGISVGPLFADPDYHNYFYQVKPIYATATRPTYDPGGGYSGSRITVTLDRRFGRFWIGGFIRYDNLSGAAFNDSPLVTGDDYIAGGFGVTWILATSKTMVDRP